MVKVMRIMMVKVWFSLGQDIRGSVMQKMMVNNHGSVMVQWWFNDDSVMVQSWFSDGSVMFNDA